MTPAAIFFVVYIFGVPQMSAGPWPGGFAQCETLVARESNRLDVMFADPAQAGSLVQNGKPVLRSDVTFECTEHPPEIKDGER
jgi:hypothetical protein